MRYQLSYEELIKVTVRHFGGLPTSIPAQRSLILLIGLLLVAEELTHER
jgi:hypothetical protein